MTPEQLYAEIAKMSKSLAVIAHWAPAIVWALVFLILVVMFKH